MKARILLGVVGILFSAGFVVAGIVVGGFALGLFPDNAQSLPTYLSNALAPSAATVTPEIDESPEDAYYRGVYDICRSLGEPIDQCNSYITRMQENDWYGQDSPGYAPPGAELAPAPATTPVPEGSQ